MNTTNLNIAELLQKAGTKYRKTLLAMPVATLQPALQHMSLKTGCQGKQVGGELIVDAQLRPYRSEKGATGGVKIEPYEWDVFLGDCVKEFDPHGILGTLYTQATGKKPDKYTIAKLVAMEMAKKVGESLFFAMFTAKRNATGDNSTDLFNGFSTLIDAAITSGAISTAKGNFTDLSTTPLDASNVGDGLKECFRSLNHRLRQIRPNLYMPNSLLFNYEDWFQVEYGHAPWNAGLRQKTLAGSDGACKFVNLENMEDQKYVIFTTKGNMKVGVDQESDKETVEIRRIDNPKLVQFFMKSHFGTGFDCLNKEFIHVVKIKA